MFKKISCIALGAVATSLISAVEPAQALSFRSTSTPSVSSLSSFGSQPTSFGQSFNSQFSGLDQSSFGSSSSGLISRTPGRTAIGGGGDYLIQAAMLGLIAFALGWGTDTTGERTAVRGGPVYLPPVDLPPSTPPGTPTPVPTPALLPGLFGMGIAAIRKRNKQVQAN
ncbi:PTPA-CTERM sorting domain-containing protein [Leptothoe sp. PORK10 BA2]|uniref:PTPA-CTERM sorting domain-containing protein n=1 Tax=Leptothoe sp. PORK10 BA2 TaxID=3110254 RepID=UPI002B1FD7CD|nr:PTPA-CTERM sorting domain-containing protein [Leptothoe sp. PORK10 BA2]MEA5466129.1 PTPA-CTERM sorting domain-containing protein [Leptothoe sp. PORK10 BA2]